MTRLLMVFCALLVGTAFSQMPGQQLRSALWTGTLTGHGVHADGRIETADGVECKLFVDLRGLTPGGHYSLYYEADHRRIPVASNGLADRQGRLTWSTQLSTCPSESLVTVVIGQQQGSRTVDLLRGVLRRQ